MKIFLRQNPGKLLLLNVLLILSGSASYSQHFSFTGENSRLEAGLNFGPTFFLGDLGGHQGKGTHFLKDLNLPLTKMMKGVFIAVYPNDWLGIRVASQFTYVEGRDNIIGTNGEDELWRK